MSLVADKLTSSYSYAVQAVNVSLPYESCDAFVFQPTDGMCADPPRGNTVVTEYVSSGGSCAWVGMPSRTPTECACHKHAYTDVTTGNCRCNLGFWGSGKSFCYPSARPEWRSVAPRGQAPPALATHAMAQVNMHITDVMLILPFCVLTFSFCTQLGGMSAWLFGGRDAAGTLHGGLYSLDLRNLEWRFHGVAKEQAGPGAREGHTLAAHGTKVYCLGGQGSLPP
jgi:hypothetical protein